MKLNKVTETGFYTGELDTEREIIFEVIENTDEVWLKETPEQKLLIDEWTYKYTDEDNRKHYEIDGGNLVSVVNAEPFDVVKITDTKYTMDVSDPTIASKCNGTVMMEDKPTRLEIAQEQLNQLKTENEGLKKQVCGLRPELKSMIDETCRKYNIEAKTYHEKIVEIINNLDKYEQTLAEIKEIAEQCFGKEFCTSCKYCKQCYVENGKISTYDVCKIILQKSENVR